MLIVRIYDSTFFFTCDRWNIASGNSSGGHSSVFKESIQKKFNPKISHCTSKKHYFPPENKVCQNSNVMIFKYFSRLPGLCSPFWILAISGAGIRPSNISISSNSFINRLFPITSSSWGSSRSTIFAEIFRRRSPRVNKWTCFVVLSYTPWKLSPSPVYVRSKNKLTRCRSDEKYLCLYL